MEDEGEMRSYLLGWLLSLLMYIVYLFFFEPLTSVLHHLLTFTPSSSSNDDTSSKSVKSGSTLWALIELPSVPE